MAKIKLIPPAPADLECGGMVVNIKTGAIGWVIWAEADAVAVEISFGTGRNEWDVDRWPLGDVVVPGSCSSPSRAVQSGTPSAPAREAKTPAVPATSEQAGTAGTDGPEVSAAEARGENSPPDGRPVPPETPTTPRRSHSAWEIKETERTNNGRTAYRLERPGQVGQPARVRVAMPCLPQGGHQAQEADAGLSLRPGSQGHPDDPGQGVPLANRAPQAAAGSSARDGRGPAALHPSRAVSSGSPAAAAREASDSPAPGAGLRPGAGPSTEEGRS